MEKKIEAFKKAIVHLVLGKANPERLNGVNKVVHQLATTQKALGMEVCVWGITNNAEHNYPKREFDTFLFPSSSQKWKLNSKLDRAISSISKDTIFHIHGVFIFDFFLVARKLHARGIPYIVSPHGSLNPYALKKNGFIKNLYFNFLEKKLLTNAKAVHLLGKTNFDYLEKLHPGCKKVLVPNGIYYEDIPVFPHHTNQEIIFGSCGRLDILHKGLDLMIEGFHAFLASGGTGKMQLIGGGPDQKKLQQMVVQFGLEDEVIFCGPKYGKEKFQYLSNVDVFVQTSRFEGMPMSILEAAASKLPCLISKNTNLGEMVQCYQAGFVLEQNAPHCIAKAMHQAKHKFLEGELQDMGSNAVRMVIEQFSWPKIAKEFGKVYGTITSEAPVQSD